METEKLVIVDAFAHLYRGFYALPPLNNSSGQPTNAIFAFAKILLSIERDYPASFGAVAFDKGKAVHRIKIDQAYKATRPPMPPDLFSQIPFAKKIAEAFGWPSVEFEGYEADDIISVLCAKFAGAEIKIASSDKDLSQLVNDKTSLLVPNKKSGGFDIIGEDGVFAKFAVRPAEIVDYLSLVGDHSDNIAGVEGIGPKTAAKLMAQFGSIENILSKADSIENERIRTAIKNSAERLEKNKMLIRLPSSLPMIDCDGKEIFLKKTADYGAVEKICHELELKSILTELAKKKPSATTPPPLNESPDLFDFK
jgi:DNA polymerase-1